MKSSKTQQHSVYTHTWVQDHVVLRRWQGVRLNGPQKRTAACRDTRRKKLQLKRASNIKAGSGQSYPKARVHLITQLKFYQ